MLADFTWLCIHVAARQNLLDSSWQHVMSLVRNGNWNKLKWLQIVQSPDATLPCGDNKWVVPSGMAWLTSYLQFHL